MSEISLMDLVGDWGKVQLLMYIFVQYIYITYSWQSLQLVFFLPDVEISCANESTRNASNFDACSDSCQHIQFNKQEFVTTLTEKLGLVCSQSWLRSFGTTVLMASGMITNLIGGELSDRFGRRKVVLASLVPYTLGALLILVVQNYAMLVIGLILVGMSYVVTFNFSYVLLFELCGAKQRSLVSMTMDAGFSIGALLIGGVSWILRDWFWIQVVNLSLILVLGLCWFLPESPIWLLKKSRQEDCVKEIERIIKINGRRNKITDNTTLRNLDAISEFLSKNKSPETKPEEYSLKQLFLLPEFRGKILNVSFFWFSVTFVHYGFILHVKFFVDNLFLNFMLSALCCWPSIAVSVLLIRMIDLKWIIVIYSSVTTVFCCFYGLAQSLPCFKAATVIIGWILSSNVLILLYQFTSELFPTTVRGKAVGVGTFMCRLGASIAPFTKEMGEASASYVPMLLLGFLSAAVAGLMARTGQRNVDFEEPDCRTELLDT